VGRDGRGLGRKMEKGGIRGGGRWKRESSLSIRRCGMGDDFSRLTCSPVGSVSGQAHRRCLARESTPL